MGSASLSLQVPLCFWSHGLNLTEQRLSLLTEGTAVFSKHWRAHFNSWQ